MRHLIWLAVVFSMISAVRAQEINRDIPYTDSKNERQVLDIYSPTGA